MNLRRSSLLGGEMNHLLYILAFKYRKVLILILIAVIFFSGAIAVQAFISMERKLKNLSQYEPIYVLKVNRDIDQGELIGDEDLSVTMFYKHEFEKLSIVDRDTGLSHSSLINCEISSGKIIPSENLVGRVALIPILKNSILRLEYLAPSGTLPGLINLVSENHSLIDFEVDKKGFNVFIKPGDKVNLIELNKSKSQLLAKDVKVLLVDSMGMGKAPIKANVAERSKRNLTLEIPNEVFEKVLLARKTNSLALTYQRLQSIQPEPERKNFGNSDFQKLTFIQGKQKRIIQR